MPHQTEPSANNALGRLLQRMLPGCEVSAEHTRIIDGHPGLQPDIIVTAAGRSPVVIEAEYDPAANAEDEAKSRLGLEVAARPIEAAAALRYPSALDEAADLGSALSAARLSYCVFTQERNNDSRFPTSGWLHGSVEDVADLIRLVSVPQRAVDRAAQELEEGIDRAASYLEEVAKVRPSIGLGIAKLLGMTNVRQTWRMAGAIIANALIFHERLAGMHPGVKSVEMLGGPSATDLKRETLAAWSRILDINYWPIFSVARDIVGQLESSDAAVVLHRLCGTATWVRSSGVDNAHDLTGRVFQRLIADRKYLATFYTPPASAALLARLAVAKLEGVDWSDSEAIGKLRVVDFACGTGALLSAVYERIAARHERAGGDAAALHAAMMEEVLYGFDVMPSAVHITGSTLAGAQPAGRFGNSRLYPLAYGRQSDGTVKIGSLELLRSSGTLTMINTSDPGRRTGSAGEETAAQIIAETPDNSFDMVIMNPPFTRATNHEGAHADVRNPAFAAFGATEDDMKAMGKRLNQKGRGTAYHGNAGIASAFAALADSKLKQGGVLALVLPLSAAVGLSWTNFRRMLARDYANLNVLSIAASDNDDLSFSADTGMAECLVVARKRRYSEPRAARVHFTSLAHRPQGFVHAGAIAKHIHADGEVRRVEDGPYGGTPLRVGNEKSGAMLTAPCETDDAAWGSVRLSDYSLAQTAYALTKSRLWPPGSPAPLNLNIVRLGKVGELGLVDRDITGPRPRGPFDKTAPEPTATYPALWNHDTRKESRLFCAPDSQLLVRMGMEAKAATAWNTSSRAHLNRDFRFNSQALCASFTEEKTLGGIAWPNVSFANSLLDYSFVLWCNSTIGLLLYWWHANRQQAGRGRTTIRNAETFPVLDFRALSDSQLNTAEVIFEEFRDKDFQPAYLADVDANRALLDRYVICDLLGLDHTIYEAVRRMAAKWCAEPSVHGGKPRPRNAELVLYQP